MTTYVLNPATGSVEPLRPIKEEAQRLVAKGAEFDSKLLLWYGEQQHKFLR